MHKRDDAPVTQHLAATWGPATARAWQALPYLVLPGDGFLAYLQGRADDLIASYPTLERLPWHDCVIDCGRLVADSLYSDGPADPRMRTLAATYVRLATRERFLAGRREVSPWWAEGLPAPFAEATARDAVIVELWDGVALGLGATMPMTIIVPAGQPWGPATPTCLIPDIQAAGFPAARAQSRSIVQTVLLALAYLTRCDEHLVLVVPEMTDNQRRAEAKTAGKRPWLRADLPRYILIDPDRAGDYGCAAPVGPRPPGDATHASPRPHGRRGHWRQLRAACFVEKRAVWVAPAWIGPREWRDEGQRYRVVTPAADQGIARGGPVPFPEDQT